MHICPCVRDHVPNPKILHRHHIVPKSWGGTDTFPAVYMTDHTAASNVVHLCPTAHENTHRLLNLYVRAMAEPAWDVRRTYTTMERWMAKTAWDWWTTMHEGEKPPWTLGATDTVDVD